MNRSGNEQVKIREIKMQFEETLEKLKRENSDLHNRAYQLNS